MLDSLPFFFFFWAKYVWSYLSKETVCEMQIMVTTIYRIPCIHEEVYLEFYVNPFI